MESSPLGLLLVLALVLVNGFFVATEFAIVAVRASRLEQLVSDGKASARDAQRVVGRLDTSIAACQLGITMASLALGWVGEPAFSSVVEPPLEALVGPFGHEAAEVASATASFALITMLHIVLGELAPKGIALQRTEGTALFVARPMLLFQTVFAWPIAALNGVGNGVLRLFGLHPASGHEMVHSVEELRLVVTGMQQAGVVESSEARIAARAFSFADRTAGELMTPRTAVDAAPLSATVGEVIEHARRSSHSRLLIYDGSLDNVVGAVRVRDLLGVSQDRGRPLPPELVHPVALVPGTKPADVLLEELRTGRQQMAVVLDEYGGTAGLVTVLDLLEALVGPIEPEASRRDATPAASASAWQPDGSILLIGGLRLHDLEEILGTSLEEEREGADTVGGLIMEHLGRIPAVGDEVPLRGRRLRVEEVVGRRVARVRLLPAGP